MRLKGTRVCGRAVHTNPFDAISRLTSWPDLPASDVTLAVGDLGPNVSWRATLLIDLDGLNAGINSGLWWVRDGNKGTRVWHGCPSQSQPPSAPVGKLRTEAVPQPRSRRITPVLSASAISAVVEVCPLRRLISLRMASSTGSDVRITPRDFGDVARRARHNSSISRRFIASRER